MNNSLVAHIKAYVCALFKDIAYAYTKPNEWKRDQTRLLHELEISGHRVMTIDLPAICKHFDRCLAEGEFRPSGLRFTAGSRGKSFPKLLGNLFEQIFHDDGKLRKDPSISAITTVRQVLAGFKKLELPVSGKALHDARKEFFAIEATIRPPTKRWDLDTTDIYEGEVSFTDLLPNRDPSCSHDLFGCHVETGSRGIWEHLQRICDAVAAQFGDFHLELPNELPKHGPGVVSNLARGASKYGFPFWSDKLEHVFPQDLYAEPSLGLAWDPDNQVSRSRDERPSRLIAVPKTAKSPRLIACEPVEHQWIQQLVRNQLEGRCARSPIAESVRFSDQTRNQEWALEGSKSGELATLDLSSASDRLSCWVIERAFRSNWTLLDRLHASRTRWLVDRTIPGWKEYLHLRKFAPMGSACTFPVQTIVYTCVALAAVIPLGTKVSEASIRTYSRQVRVFGDDIIVPAHALSVLVKLLTELGLKVNTDKTFGVGNFRESCGTDAFCGHEVTPCYLSFVPGTKVQTDDVVSLIDSSNRYHSRGYWNVAQWVTDLIPAKYLKLLPTARISAPRTKYEFSHVEGIPGLASFCGASIPAGCETRLSKDLQRKEVKVLLKVDRPKKVRGTGQNSLFQYFIERPSPLTRWSAGVVTHTASYWKLGWYPADYIVGQRV